ncbi:Hachiman antiphage defense system protein HamA [Paracnuella aquatica]|uniref:Hachiman antiphage defense system protein HamA n=1 Tax=Paracnuella aquatica TaxID=2268757 RepID=UPI000DEEE113|nr:Hachiman antiphage defense system protein HamA [Paracnuella aquatica]RPD51083.1 DUF1837 domain-containing protein [Paracnuella aquatica]
MRILDHFVRKNEKDFVFYKLKEKELETFINKLTQNFRLCYISDEELTHKCKANGMTTAEFLESYVLPDDGKIKSGDFGEMFCHYAVVDNWGRKGKLFTGPLKWRWKDRNKPMQYADSIMFYMPDKRASSEDMLLTIESKMKATKSTQHRIQDAIDGATLDKLSRISKTLEWLEEKYARLGLIKERNLVRRYKDPASYGNFNIVNKAIAVVDCECETGEIDKAFENKESVSVIVFSMKDLKSIYERTRVNIINSDCNAE